MGAVACVKGQVVEINSRTTGLVARSDVRDMRVFWPTGSSEKLGAISPVSTSRDGPVYGA